jgi:hypothetical protein
MKLFKELNEEMTLLVEEKDGKKILHLEGICIQTNVKNRNKRIYPKDNVRGEIERYIKEEVNTNRAVGELNHPLSPGIDLSKVSHRFVSLTEDGDNYKCKVRILDTPMGQVARGLIEGGVQLGISTRALGSVKPNSQGINEVQKDFRLSTAGDLVANPSAPDAFLNSIMEEREWVFKNGIWAEKDIHEMQSIVRKLPSEKAVSTLWEQFLLDIATK